MTLREAASYLQIAVHQAFAVDVVDGARDLVEDVEDTVSRSVERVRAQPVAQALALAQLHLDVEEHARPGGAEVGRARRPAPAAEVGRARRGRRPVGRPRRGDVDDGAVAGGRPAALVVTVVRRPTSGVAEHDVERRRRLVERVAADGKLHAARRRHVIDADTPMLRRRPPSLEPWRGGGVRSLGRGVAARRRDVAARRRDVRRDVAARRGAARRRHVDADAVAPLLPADRRTLEPRLVVAHDAGVLQRRQRLHLAHHTPHGGVAENQHRTRSNKN